MHLSNDSLTDCEIIPGQALRTSESRASPCVGFQYVFVFVRVDGGQKGGHYGGEKGANPPNWTE